ncbi:hypothetical protein NDU88_001738 [Pleurodeles waltl]|uniref:Uncharacterized protein n=1 Tax=Pleurodeles waltl TaxID=8319 RepID=A0AAV7UVJ5_PLEWA|nr:hypothetical protein NDU88_001738 [Pleurodeles waltl]
MRPGRIRPYEISYVYWWGEAEPRTSKWVILALSVVQAWLLIIRDIRSYALHGRRGRRSPQPVRYTPPKARRGPHSTRARVRRPPPQIKGGVPGRARRPFPAPTRPRPDPARKHRPVLSPRRHRTTLLPVLGRGATWSCRDAKPYQGGLAHCRAPPVFLVALLEGGRTGSRGVPQAAPQPAGPLPGPTAAQAQQPSTPPAIPRGSRTGRPDRRAHVSPAAGGPPRLPIHSTRRVLLPRIQQLITGPSAATFVSLRAAPGTGGVASAFYDRPGTRDQDIRQEGGPRAELFSQASAPAAILATIGDIFRIEFRHA